MEKSTKITLSNSGFIHWLISRLKYLHNYDDNNDIVKRLLFVKDCLVRYERQCTDDDLDKIISKYFVDFFLTKDEGTSIGYTDQERISLRNTIKHIIQDIRNNDVPKEPLLK